MHLMEVHKIGIHIPLRGGNDEVLARAVEYEDYIRNGNQPSSTNDPSKIHGIKRLSI
jgi:hypothetical protein